MTRRKSSSASARRICVEKNGGVVDEAVDAPLLLFGALDEGAAALRAGGVEGEHSDALDFGHAVGLAHAGHDPGAALLQFARRGEADAAIGPGDKNNFTRKGLDGRGHDGLSFPWAKDLHTASIATCDDGPAGFRLRKLTKSAGKMLASPKEFHRARTMVFG